MPCSIEECRMGTQRRAENWWQGVPRFASEVGRHCGVYRAFLHPTGGSAPFNDQLHHEALTVVKKQLNGSRMTATVQRLIGALKVTLTKDRLCTP
jgi:hypothetical protein